MTRLLTGTIALAAACAIGGCASYHALPLPEHAQLANNLSELTHTLPSPTPGQSATLIDVTHPLSLEQIGLLAILNDPELRTERGEFELAKADLTQSSLLPNPSIGLGYAALLGGPGTTGAYTASLSEDIASLVTYRRRVAAERAHVSQVNADLLWQECQVAQKAHLLAIDLYWGELSISSSQSVLASTQRTVSQVKASVSAGDLSAAELAPLLSTQASLEQSINALRMTQSQNWQDLDALLGMQPGARFAIAMPDIPALPADVERLIANVATRRPDLIALQLGYRSANEKVRAAILGQFPAFVLGGSWNADTSDVRSAGPTATFDLPIFNRNQGDVARTRATRLLLHEQYQSRLDTTVASIQGLRARSRRIAAALVLARDGTASAASLAQSARQAYLHNDLDQRALSDYENTALSRRLEMFELERGLDETHVALVLELGLGLPQTRIAPLDPVR